MTPAGELNKRVRIERFVPADPPTDTFGKPVGTWETVATVWGKIVAAASREAVGEEIVQAVRSWTITIRRRAVDETMRVVFRFAGVEHTANVGGTGGDEDDTTLAVTEVPEE